jgi:hypothetical protein
MADVATSPIPIVTGGLPAYGVPPSPGAGEPPAPDTRSDASSSISAATQPIIRPPHSTRE